MGQEERRLTLKKAEVTADINQCTKRKVLSLVSQLWDPVGIVAPVSIQFRIHLQELWAAGYGWDESLPPEEQEKWRKNCAKMNMALNTSLERPLKPEGAVGSPQLHGFSDGGELAYGAAIFLRWKLIDGKFGCSFVAAKALVAPLKKRTIPRLELMGCVVLSRLATEVAHALAAKFEKRVFWCDSTTVLTWIRSPSTQFKPFVSSRVAEIQESHPKDVWHYITSEENPADALTRGINPEKLQTWHQGPRFIQNPEGNWSTFECERETARIPKEQTDPERKSKAERKARKSEKRSTGPLPKSPERNAEQPSIIRSPKEKKDEERLVSAAVVTETNEDSKETIERILSRTSTLRKARRVVALTARAIQNFLHKEKITGPISATEYQETEKRLIRMVQVDMNVDSKRVRDINPFLDGDGIWKASGRLENIRDLPQEMCKEPFIINSCFVVPRD
jgi:hypothetical protein